MALRAIAAAGLISLMLSCCCAGLIRLMDRVGENLIRQHVDANGRRLVIIRGDLRVTGGIEKGEHSDVENHESLEARIKDLEDRLNALTAASL